MKGSKRSAQDSSRGHLDQCRQCDRQLRLRRSRPQSRNQPLRFVFVAEAGFCSEDAPAPSAAAGHIADIVNGSLDSCPVQAYCFPYQWGNASAASVTYSCRRSVSFSLCDRSAPYLLLSFLVSRVILFCFCQCQENMLFMRKCKKQILPKINSAGKMVNCVL